MLENSVAYVVRELFVEMCRSEFIKNTEFRKKNMPTRSGPWKGKIFELRSLNPAKFIWKRVLPTLMSTLRSPSTQKLES